MKPRNFPERKIRRRLLAQCRAAETEVVRDSEGRFVETRSSGFRTPFLSIGHGSASEVAAVNAQLVEALAVFRSERAK